MTTNDIQQFFLRTYMVFNKELYRGILPLPDFFVVLSRKECKNEWCTSFNGSITVKITYNSLIKSIEKDTVLQDLLHQMVHIYCHINGIKDTTRQGRYHNRNFRQVAQDYGLEVETDPGCGARITGCQKQIMEILQKELPGFSREVGYMKHLLQRSSGQTHTYICPSCRRTVTGDKDTKLICGYCYTEMTPYW